MSLGRFDMPKTLWDVCSCHAFPQGAVMPTEIFPQRSWWAVINTSPSPLSLQLQRQIFQHLHQLVSSSLIFLQLLVSIFSPSPHAMAQHSELQPPARHCCPTLGCPTVPPAQAQPGGLQAPKQQHPEVFNQRFRDLNGKGYSDPAFTSPLWLSERAPGFHGQRFWKASGQSFQHQESALICSVLSPESSLH